MQRRPSFMRIRSANEVDLLHAVDPAAVLFRSRRTSGQLEWFMMAFQRRQDFEGGQGQQHMRLRGAKNTQSVDSEASQRYLMA